MDRNNLNRLSAAQSCIIPEAAVEETMAFGSMTLGKHGRYRRYRVDTVPRKGSLTAAPVAGCFRINSTIALCILSRMSRYGLEQLQHALRTAECGGEQADIKRPNDAVRLRSLG